METFLAVAEERSFSRAAARLHRTQPAVSQAIAKLEQELGEVLFERTSRDGTLTDAGEVLREDALKLLNLRTEASGALTELRELHRGKLNLAANEYTCLYLLPLLDEFRRQNPLIKVTVQRALASRICGYEVMHSLEIGSGVALVPGLTVRTELASGALVRVRVKELQLERKLRLVYRRQASLSH